MWPENERIQVVLIADCLFVKELHDALLHTIDVLLAADDGHCYIMAPKRGGSLDEFVVKAGSKGWHVDVTERYDDLVWQQHEQALVASPDTYAFDSHYPILVQLGR